MMKKSVSVLTAACAVAFASAFSDVDAIIKRHAAENGVDAKLVKAVIKVESAGNPNALSHKNARGLMQVIPPTAARMGVNPAYLFHPEHNIAAGTRYLSYLTRLFNGNLDYVLAGYNAGEGAVKKYGGIPPYKETQKYVAEVRKRYSALADGAVNPSGHVAAGSEYGNNHYLGWVMSVPYVRTAATKNTVKAEPVLAVRKVASKPVKVVVRKPKTYAPAVKLENPIPKQSELVAQAKPTSGSFVKTLDNNGNFVDL